jgi:hypothetical protein
MTATTRMVTTTCRCPGGVGCRPLPSCAMTELSPGRNIRKQRANSNRAGSPSSFKVEGPPPAPSPDAPQWKRLFAQHLRGISQRAVSGVGP